ncbi:hypothetical protein NC653_008113 [Populus alba x Populus x berolinensis]|uniref:Uncharacterized protein n=1 Tax=Populus alba x Populus x berolinensis TaxID=444605 RepID=A0AAD6W828_9ROSI|nr:hypothetical protein NC653_008113 [Populus alba x Populus x berolinensis]
MNGRLRVRAALSTTLFTGIVETEESVKYSQENTIDCPTVNGVCPPTISAFLSPSIFEVSFPPFFPSSGTRNETSRPGEVVVALMEQMTLRKEEVFVSNILILHQLPLLVRQGRILLMILQMVGS